MQTPPYLRLWLIALLAVVIAVVYWPSTIIFYEKWSDYSIQTFTHGWLILAICVALVVRSRREIAAAPAKASGGALLALAGAVVLWLVCYRASIEGLEVPFVPVIFWLAATAAFGWAVGRLLLFPVGYFYFAVPAWYGTPLKDLTVLVMRGVLALTGPPATITGDVISLPNGAFIIEEGCSGLHFMIVGLAVAALYGEQRRDPWRIRLRQLALMAALALLANWVRVYTVIQAGYLTNMQSYLVRVSHLGFGWCVFAAALLVFFWVAPVLEPDTVPVSASTPPPVRPTLLRPELTGFVAAIATLLLLPGLSAALKLAHQTPAVRESGSVDPSGGWHPLPDDIGSEWMPLFAAADLLKLQSFGNSAGDTVQVLTVGYRTQRQGAELVGETSSLVGEGLQSVAEQVVDSPAGAFGEVEVIDARHARSLIWWRYEVAGRKLVSPFAQQVWYGINAIAWNPSASLIALRAACGADCNSARRPLRDFIASSDLR
jgi:exosortase